MTRKGWINLLKLLLAASLVVFVLRQVELYDYLDPASGERRNGLLTYLKELDVPLFLLGSLFFFIVAWVSSVRWWWLLRVNDLRVSLGQAFRFTWIGIFFSNVVPGLTGGDVVKAVYVSRATGRKLRPVLSVLVDRVLGLIALALLAAVVVLFMLDDPDFRWIAAGLWGGLILLVTGTALFLSRRVRRSLRIDALLKRLPMSGALMKFDEAMTHYRGHLRGIFVWLLLSSINHLIGVVGVIFIGNALHGDMPWHLYLVLVPIINIASALPIAPAGWGVGETAFGYLWKLHGALYAPKDVAPALVSTYMLTQGVALSVVYRVHLMLWSLLGAILLVLGHDRPTTEELGLIEEIDDGSGDESAATTS